MHSYSYASSYESLALLTNGNVTDREEKVVRMHHLLLIYSAMCSEFSSLQKALNFLCLPLSLRLESNKLRVSDREPRGPESTCHGVLKQITVTQVCCPHETTFTRLHLISPL